MNKKIKRKYTKNQYQKRLAWMRAYTKVYKKLNKDKIHKYEKKYRKKYPLKRAIYQAAYFKKRIQTDHLYKLRVRLRTRIKQAIKNNWQTGFSVTDLGCSITFLKNYIQSKFYSNMTWDNWGEVWELDHVIPLCKFDLTDRDQFLKAVHYTNLQPLTIEDHRKKTSKDVISYEIQGY